MFRCLTRYAGKGERDGMKRLRGVNESNEIIATYLHREAIEKQLPDHNTEHFQQVYEYA